MAYRSSKNVPLYYFQQPPSVTRSLSSSSARSNSSSMSGGSPSAAGFSDVASTSSSYTTQSSGMSSEECKHGCKCMKCSLGDYVFETEEEYLSYKSIVEEALGHSMDDDNSASSPGSSELQTPFSESSTFDGYSADLEARPTNLVEHRHHRHHHHPTLSRRSGGRRTGDITFSSSRGLPSLPQLPSSLASQNPKLNDAMNALTSKLERLSSYNSEDDSEDDYSCRPCVEETDKRFERALMLANWQKGTSWAPPDGTVSGLKKLVQMAL